MSQFKNTGTVSWMLKRTTRYLKSSKSASNTPGEEHKNDEPATNKPQPNNTGQNLWSGRIPTHSPTLITFHGSLRLHCRKIELSIGCAPSRLLSGGKRAERPKRTILAWAQIQVERGQNLLRHRWRNATRECNNKDSWVDWVRGADTLPS